MKINRPVKLIIFYVILMASVLLFVNFYPKPLYSNLTDLEFRPFQKNAFVKLIKTKYFKKETKSKTKKVLVKALKSPLEFVPTAKYLHQSAEIKKKFRKVFNFQSDLSYFQQFPLKNKNLTRFYKKLLYSQLHPQSPRIKIHLFGDSLVSGDVLPKYFRRLFFDDFGNGGAGFVCVQKPNNTYYNSRLQVKARGWKIASYQDRKLVDHYLGLNGYSLTSSEKATSWFFSRHRGLFENVKIYYHTDTNGGDFKIDMAHKSYILDSYSKKPKSAFFTITNSSKIDRLKLTSTHQGNRVFGVEFYNNHGITFNVFPFIGAEIKTVLRINQESWVMQLKESNPDLILLMFWGNKSSYSLLGDKYKPQWNKFCDNIKKASPHAAVIILGPMGVPRLRKGNFVVKPIIKYMISALKDVATSHDFLFLDLFKLSGGKEKLDYWYGLESKLISPDKIHFSQSGSREISHLIYQELMTGYKSYLEKKGYL